MANVFRRPPSPPAKGDDVPKAPPNDRIKREEPTRASVELHEGLKKHLAQLEQHLARLRAENASLRVQIETENRNDPRLRKLKQKLAGTNDYLKAAKAAATHWFAEAHRLADGRPLVHRRSPCSICGDVDAPLDEHKYPQAGPASARPAT